MTTELSQSTTSEDYYRQSQQSLDTNGSLDLQHAPPPPQMYTDTLNGGRVYNPTMPQLHTPQTPPQPLHQSQSSDQSYSARQAALPAYRPTPSYEEVMRFKMSQQTAVQQPTIRHAMQGSGKSLPPVQPCYFGYTDTKHNIGSEIPGYAPENDYVNSSTINNINNYSNSTMYANVFQEEKNKYIAQYRMNNEHTSNLIMQPTTSTPELNSQAIPQQYPVDNMMGDPSVPLHYKPPPPYPTPRGSSSTPDLAVQTQRAAHISDSPDLVSRKTLGLSALGLQTNYDIQDNTLTKTFPKPLDLNPVGNISNKEVIRTDLSAAAPQISVSQADTADACDQDHDDASSDQSGATFHIKDTDIESDDESSNRGTLKREGSKRESNIQIKYVAPNKAPPPSTSKELVTRRESFRRMMIARTGPIVPSTFTADDKTTSGIQNAAIVIPEQTDHSLVNKNQSKPVERKHSLQQAKVERRISTNSNLERKLSLLEQLERTKLERNTSLTSQSSAASVDTSVYVPVDKKPSDSQVVTNLNIVPPIGNLRPEEAVQKIKELSAQEEGYNEVYSSDDSDTEAVSLFQIFYLANFYFAYMNKSCFPGFNFVQF